MRFNHLWAFGLVLAVPVVFTDVRTEAELSDTAHEPAPTIGIISVATWRHLLAHFRGKHPELLPALVLAGFCGLRRSEIHAQTWHTCFGLQTLGLRFFNVFGPRQDPNGAYAAVIPQWIAAMKAGRDVFVTFQPRADSEHFCVALASMASKYLRELFMLEFNRFWQEKVPGLAPTAG